MSARIKCTNPNQRSTRNRKNSKDRNSKKGSDKQEISDEEEVEIVEEKADHGSKNVNKMNEDDMDIYGGEIEDDEEAEDEEKILDKKFAKNLYLGIDLGTTEWCISRINRNFKCEVIPNAMGDDTTPSAVLFKRAPDGNIITVVGKAAMNKKGVEDENVCVCWDWKRIIGRKYVLCVVYHVYIRVC